MKAEWTPTQLADWELDRPQAELVGKIKIFADGSATVKVLHGELAGVIVRQRGRRCRPVNAAVAVEVEELFSSAPEQEIPGLADRFAYKKKSGNADSYNTKDEIET